VISLSDAVLFIMQKRGVELGVIPGRRYWSRDPRIGFPPEVRINKRIYYSRAEIEAWKASRAVGGTK
jgi:hypothetical protein